MSSPSPDAIAFVGGNRDDRAAAVREHLEGVRRRASGIWIHEDAGAASWPFSRGVTPRALAPGPGVIWVRDLHLAFPSGQSSGTRLVLTQSTYQLQRWLDWLSGRPGVHLIADADLSALAHSSREVLTRRGPWYRIEMHEVASQAPSEEIVPDNALHVAFRQASAERRLDACRSASDAAPQDAALLLAFSSACMELQLLDDARRTLERAAAVDAEWEAVHFEQGKLWLRLEDTARAAASFAAAARLMPAFASAWLNLGGALGELGRPAEALDALQHALEHDPLGYPILNNIGTVHREEGRLDEAEEAYRRVIALAPAFVFGYYNLGHTLLLKGVFAEARRAYEDGFARDAQKNTRQACRLAVARAAAGDTDGAIALVEELGAGLPAERAREIFEEAESTLTALSAVQGVDAEGTRRVIDALRRYSS